MAKYVKIVEEDDNRWNVECWAPACTNLITIPKRITSDTGRTIRRQEPVPAGCVVHGPPPHAS